MAGAEPFSFSGRGEVGVLLVHGFTGTPFEVRPLGEHLAGQDIASSGVLLRGHGTHPNDMLGCRYQDWIDDAEAGLEELLRTNRGVVLVGFSMGGTIALNIAARRA
nr:alpha/beta fold hydrolase [Chloroflexota bacterium]